MQEWHKQTVIVQLDSLDAMNADSQERRRQLREEQLSNNSVSVIETSSRGRSVTTWSFWDVGDGIASAIDILSLFD